MEAKKIRVDGTEEIDLPTQRPGKGHARVMVCLEEKGKGKEARWSLSQQLTNSKKERYATDTSQELKHLRHFGGNI